jgi:hypothetical protein
MSAREARRSVVVAGWGTRPDKCCRRGVGAQPSFFSHRPKSVIESVNGPPKAVNPSQVFRERARLVVIRRGNCPQKREGDKSLACERDL